MTPPLVSPTYQTMIVVGSHRSILDVIRQRSDASAESPV